MAKYYYTDVSRWEGEGGAPDADAVLALETLSADAPDYEAGTLPWWQIALGFALLMGSVLYARQKGWISTSTR